MIATTIDSIHRHLDIDPSDSIARLVLADALEEAGDPLAPGYRALGWLKRASYGWSSSRHWGYGHNPDRYWKRLLSGRPSTKDDWLVYADELGLKKVVYDGFVYAQGPDVLPTTWIKLAGGPPLSRDTRRSLEDAVAAAWLLLSPEKQEEYLDGIATGVAL